MRTCHSRAASALVASALALLPPILPASARPAASPLVGKSYCFNDTAALQRLTFTGQSGNKLLGSLTAYRQGTNDQAWRFPLLTAPKANGGVATLDGDQLRMVFHTPEGAPSGHDELTVDPSGDSLAGTASTYQGSMAVTFTRC